MSGDRRQLFVVILAGGLGLVLCRPAGILPGQARSYLAHGSQTRTPTKAMKVVLTFDKVKASMDDTIQADVALLNVGPDPFYVLRELIWGDTAQLTLHIRDGEREAVKPYVDPPLPPPADDPNLLVPGFGYVLRNSNVVESEVYGPPPRKVHREGCVPMSVQAGILRREGSHSQRVLGPGPGGGFQ